MVFCQNSIRCELGRQADLEAKMQPVDLPHDWLIYDTKNLYEDSIGWYRKNFAYAPDKQEMMTVSSSALKVSTWILLFM